MEEKIKTIKECINALESLQENVYLDQIKLSDPSNINNYKGYSEADRLNKVIDCLHKLDK